MLVADLRNDVSKPFWHGLCLGSTGISIFFPNVIKNDSSACMKYHFVHFELARTVQNDTLYMTSRDETRKKN